MFKTISIDVIWNFEKDQNAEMAEEFLQERGIIPLKNGLRSLIWAFHLSIVSIFNLKRAVAQTSFTHHSMVRLISRSNNNSELQRVQRQIFVVKLQKNIWATAR